MLALQLNLDAMVSCSSVAASAMVENLKNSFARGGIVMHSGMMSGEHRKRSAFFAEVMRLSKHGFFLDEDPVETWSVPSLSWKVSRAFAMDSLSDHCLEVLGCQYEGLGD